ncbi:MAG TPA: TldD/PmbA family protein, partial [Patescibacteria group bacterium]|nr:TldD/PmbA family protein [Patescibacteria group bacterium]
FLEDHSIFSVAVADGKIESLETQDVRGAGFRLFDRGRVGFAYTADLSPEGLRETVAMAKGLLAHADPDDANRLPESDESETPEPEMHDPLLARVDPQEKIRSARRVEEAARATDPRVTRVRQSKYTDVSGHVEVASTNGLRRIVPFSRVYASIEVNAEERGELQSGWYADFAIRYAALDPAHVGREAARRAVMKLGAGRVATQRANLVLDPSVAASLLEAISPALHADHVLKGKSVLGPRLGQQIGGAKVTVLDDGRLQGGDHSAPYDAEGVATRCTMLIEGGVLKGFLHSTYSSLRMGAAPTGNAFRRSFKSPPHIGPSTLYLQPTGAAPQALLMEAGDGIYINEVMGLHTIDPISGDFSLGASGMTLKAGRPDAPVDRVGIAGNVVDLLKSIAGVGTDLRFMPGGGAGSTTLLMDIAVSGT